MPASNSLKAADKQKITKKLVTELKKRYKGSVPKQNRSIFETLLFSACLEDSSYKQAEAAYARLLENFFDLNEVRVSSVKEIEQVLGEINDPDWKALRVREVLQYVFETYYAFDLDQLKRKTQDAANKELMSINHLSTFMRDYTVQHGLGAHVLPVDETMSKALKWMCLADLGETPEQAADAIKAGLKKSEGPLFCHLLKCAATDPALQPGFDEFEEVTEEDPLHASKRLAELVKKPVKKKVPKKATAKVSKKKPAKKTSSRTKTAKKNTTTKKKTVKKKVAVKKKTSKKKKTK
ncbi:hypothetical protein OAF98_04480 [Planctomicrobium sp.]|jgi:hypothetical protein|nr:hypothetical protein [Planctomicrobium sp.]MBT5018157.1 hypothetical protein [Planctomicrobium sp.]MDB4439441.1 hypothetical protein [Planctomicrobium sp.]MDB4733054.1 hypothetical protein [Planctomicrobium sp.]MDB4743722.1 hypothetical protein [Planctomicrobium sp.]